MELPIVSICLLLACLTPVSLQQDDCQNKDKRCPNMPKHGREVFCQRPWARRNCEQLCGICGDQPLVVKVSCYDINNRCAEMPRDYDVFCARPWAKRNCKKFCRLCVSDDADISSTSPPLTTTELTTTAEVTTTTATTTTTTPATTTTTPTTTTTIPTTTTTTPITTTTAIPTISPLTLCNGQDGVFTIYGVSVLCDNGWLVFQQRKNEELSFDRSMTEYRQGFGNVSGDNFWLGLDYVHRMCGSIKDNCALRVEKQTKRLHREQYNKFYLSNSQKYPFRLYIRDYEGPEEGYDFTIYNMRSFRNDYSDAEKRLCYKSMMSSKRASGWWFTSCTLDNAYNDQLRGATTKLMLMRHA